MKPTNNHRLDELWSILSGPNTSYVPLKRLKLLEAQIKDYIRQEIKREGGIIYNLIADNLPDDGEWHKVEFLARNDKGKLTLNNNSNETN